MRALVIAGPTSSGKSQIALEVAAALDGEIVNADSRQVYAGMEIGTGMPPRGDRARVPHHLYGTISPAQRYSAARYVADASAVIADIDRRGHLAVVAGGTGFYVEALAGTMPLDRPPGDDELRARLRREVLMHPRSALLGWLHALDSTAANTVRPGDSYRILRALEVVLARRGGQSADVVTRPAWLELTIVVLRVERSTLRQRIAQRVDKMFQLGLIDEAQAVRRAAPYAGALTGIGYAEALAVADGLCTRREAIALTTLRTQRYAKRQATWFRRLRAAEVVDADDVSTATERVIEKAREILAAP